MRYSILILISCFVFSSVKIFSQSSPPDIDGWNKAKWGMSEKQIDSLFGGNLKKVTLQYKSKSAQTVHLTGSPMMIFNYEFIPTFIFDSTGHLTAINLHASNESSVAVQDIFNLVKNELIRKYGVPSSSSKSFYNSKSLIWIF